MKYAAALILIGLLLACGSGGAVVTPTASAPTNAPAATVSTEAPTQAPEPTAAPVATEVPTSASEPTTAPATIVLKGVAPTGDDCPADHPVKGNIRDREPNKGEQIYHVPGSGSYAATKPERCFVDAIEAEAAGFRAPK